MREREENKNESKHRSTCEFAKQERKKKKQDGIYQVNHPGRFHSDHGRRRYEASRARAAPAASAEWIHDARSWSLSPRRRLGEREVRMDRCEPAGTDVHHGVTGAKKIQTRASMVTA